jgi:iron complex outermembrane recepter protein
MSVIRKIGEHPRFQRKLLSAAVSLSLLPLAGASLAQEPTTVEEVIVTGSFIRRTEGFRSASPLTQISLEDIAAEGTPNMGDIVHGLSFNQGSSISSNITAGLPGASETVINLRGLGAGATLDLMDGKRVIDDNVNQMLPQIAIQRLDIVLDGAAALYGSEAVAGVVNFVPIKSYDGLKFEVFNQQTSASDSYQEQMYSLLWGGDLRGVDLVVAGQWRDNSNLLWSDRPDLFYAGFNSSSSGNPGQFAVPLRDANGVLTGASNRRADPGCGTMAERTDPTVGDRPNPNGTNHFGSCYMDFGHWWELNPANQQSVFYANASYEASDDLSFNAQINWSSLTYGGEETPSGPGGRVNELPVVRGELPGNPYRAVDANGNPLFAMDGNGDGVPDRDGNGVVLMDPSGIPFNEDVVFSGWRPFGKSQTISAGHNGNGSFPGFYRERSYRAAFDMNFTVPYLDGWDGVASVMWSDEVFINRNNNQSFSAIEQGLNCDPLGPKDECFNPFAVNPNVLNPYTNSQAVADSVFPTQLLRSNTDSSLYSMDLVLNGTLALPMDYELPGGPIGMAVGFHRRGDGFDYQPAGLYQSGDLFNGQQEFPANENRDVDAWFVEVAIPVLDNLEITAASRAETYSTGQSSNDPKFGIAYSPTDWLTLRATKGTAFIAPALNALFAPERCYLSNLDDPMSSFFAYARRCQAGNPDLTPETADTQSWGITFEPINNLRIDLDWSQTEFQDRIVGIDPQQLLSLDYFNWSNATGISGREPTVEELTAWVASGRQDPRIIRAAGDPTQILRVTVGQSNAAANNVEAFDLKVRYQFDLDAITGLLGWNDLGTITANFNATKIDKWEYQKFATDPVSSPLGKRNRFLGEAPPLPEIKANLRVGWMMGNHSASIAAHYIDEVEYDGYNWNSGFFKSFTFFTPFDTSIRDTLRASTVTDVAYNYRGLDVFGTNVDLTLGSRNVFDRAPQRVNDFAGMESVLYDARGRLVYGRITMEF